MIPKILVSDDDLACQENISSNSPGKKIIHVRPEKNILTIDQIRDVSALLVSRQMKNVVVVLYGLDDSKTETHNAFLKTLEEAGDLVDLYLVVKSTSFLPDTVLSRCEVLYVKDFQHEPQTKTSVLLESASIEESLYRVTKMSKEEILHEMSILLSYAQKNIDKPGMTNFIRELVLKKNLIAKNNLQAESALDACLIYYYQHCI